MTTSTSIHDLKKAVALANAVQHDADLPPGYVLLKLEEAETDVSTPSGFQGKAVVNVEEEKIYLVFPGTRDGKDVAEWRDAALGYSDPLLSSNSRGGSMGPLIGQFKKPALAGQIRDASDFTYEVLEGVKKHETYKTYEKVAIGFSLGGALGGSAADNFALKAYIIDGLGWKQHTDNPAFRNEVKARYGHEPKGSPEQVILKVGSSPITSFGSYGPPTGNQKVFVLPTYEDQWLSDTRSSLWGGSEETGSLGLSGRAMLLATGSVWNGFGIGDHDIANTNRLIQDIDPLEVPVGQSADEVLERGYESLRASQGGISSIRDRVQGQAGPSLEERARALEERWEELSPNRPASINVDPVAQTVTVTETQDAGYGQVKSSVVLDRSGVNAQHDLEIGGQTVRLPDPVVRDVAAAGGPQSMLFIPQDRAEKALGSFNLDINNFSPSYFTGEHDPYVYMHVVYKYFGGPRWTEVDPVLMIDRHGQSVVSYDSHYISPYVKGACDIIGGARNHISPLVLDLDGDGVELTHAYGRNVYFDIDNDGYAERVGWVKADDGQLAMDRNGNGNIDDITELYGDDVMPAYDKLRQHDANKDGKIDAQDPDYANLLVWRDLNQNGLSEAGELKTLREMNIKSLDLSETPEDRWLHENYISASSTYTKFDGQTGTMVDAHFLNDNANSWYKGAHDQVFGAKVQISLEALLMPHSRGYGVMKSLHLALDENPRLMAMMRTLTRLQPDQLGEAPHLVQDILLEWAGVRHNDANARKEITGSNIDARHVDFMEKFTGVLWLQRGTSKGVGENASVGIKKAWGNIEALMTARFLAQGPLSHLFPEAQYNFKTDTVELNTSLSSILTKARAYAAPLDTDGAEQFWLEIGNILIVSKGELGVNVDTINDHITRAHGKNLFLAEKSVSAVDGVIYTGEDNVPDQLKLSVRVGDARDNTINGTERVDTVFAQGGRDAVDGRGGDDYLDGGAGHDQMSGGKGFDHLEGRDGNDVLNGGEDSDVLRGGAGRDTLRGESGDDTLAGGADADDLDGGGGQDTLDYNHSNAGVHINLATGKADGGHARGDQFRNIENVNGSRFTDRLYGDDESNTLNGEGGDDHLYGGAGSDFLFGASGQDTLYGEAGDDLFFGYDGAETMIGGTGIDTVTYDHVYNTERVVVDLSLGRGSAGSAAGDTYDGIENVNGTSGGDDILIGNEHKNVLKGLDGNDTLQGQGGHDTLRGGNGNDTLIGSGHLDHLYGGQGSDTFKFKSTEAFLASAGSVGGSRLTSQEARTASSSQSKTAFIHDFDTNDPNEKLDLSEQNLREVIVRPFGSFGTEITLDGGLRLILFGVSASELTADHIILPTGVSSLTREAPEFGREWASASQNTMGMMRGFPIRSVPNPDGFGAPLVTVGGVVGFQHHKMNHDPAQNMLLDTNGFTNARYWDQTPSTFSDLDKRWFSSEQRQLTDPGEFRSFFRVSPADFVPDQESRPSPIQTLHVDGSEKEGPDYVVEIDVDEFVLDGLLLGGTSDDDTLEGSERGDIIAGSLGNDTLKDGAGSDILTGGDGSDVFIITADSGSTDTITDFEHGRSGEYIDLSAFRSQFSDFGDLQGSLSQHGDNTHLDLGSGQTLVLQDIELTALQRDDFRWSQSEML